METAQIDAMFATKKSINYHSSLRNGITEETFCEPVSTSSCSLADKSLLNHFKRADIV